MATLIDTYNESNVDADRDIQAYSGGPPLVYQSFTGVSGVLDSCKFYMKKASGATGNMTAVLYAHSGTFGTSSKYTGTALATSDAIDISTLSTSYALVTFNFTGANRYAMSATNYVLAIINNNAGIVYVGQDGSSPSHGGNFGYNYSNDIANEGSITADATKDLAFYLYEIPATAGFFAIL